MPGSKSSEELLTAADRGKIREVEKLLSAGVDVNIKDSDGRTALHHVVRGGAVFRRPKIRNHIIHLLKQHGADLDAKTNGGDTALHFAVMFGRRAEAAMLIAEGADVDADNSDGTTPLEGLHMFVGTMWKGAGWDQVVKFAESRSVQTNPRKS